MVNLLKNETRLSAPANVVVRLCCVVVIRAQVLFNDSTESSDLSAVQVDKKSSYKAEDTSFVGFQGEVCTSETTFPTCATKGKQYIHL